MESHITVDRKAFSRDGFLEEYPLLPKHVQSCKEKVRSSCRSAFSCSVQRLKTKALSTFPFVKTLIEYKWKQDIVGDVMAGLSVGIIHVPQSMGFALLANLPPVYGLYSSFFPVMLYFIFGTSRHISFGTMAVIAMMVGSAVQREATKFEENFQKSSDAPSVVTIVTDINSSIGLDMNETNNIDDSFQEALNSRKVEVALVLSLLSGLVQIIMSFLQLGFITVYLSQPFVGGFMMGATLHIITSQVKFMLGIPTLVKAYTGPFKLILTYVDIFSNIMHTNIADLIISILCCAMLILMRKFINERYKEKLPVPIPIELIVVAIGTIASHFGKFNQKFGIRIVGNIPTGVPTPVVPPMNEAQNYIAEAFIIAIVSFAISISMAKVFTKKYNYEIDANQELFAYGVANGVGAFFHSFAGAVAPPRTLVHDSAGGKTQFASVFSSIFVLLVILVMGPLFVSLPNSVLGAIIVVSLLPMFNQFRTLPDFWRTSKYDLAIWIVTFLCATILDMDYGLFIGIGFSLLTLVIRVQVPISYSMGNIPDTELYANSIRCEKATLPDGVRIFKFEAPLFYANAEIFKQKIFKKALNPQKMNGLENDDNDDKPLSIHTIVVDCSTMAYMDNVGIGMLLQIYRKYKAIQVRVLLANCPYGVVQILKHVKFPYMDNLYMTIHDAVVAAQMMGRMKDEDDDADLKENKDDNANDDNKALVQNGDTDDGVNRDWDQTDDDANASEDTKLNLYPDIKDKVDV
ncbi:unnamed protein product [Owenia fusiformis]|uniref:Uncharacterized protein n=1 Tax=Owenia fusiformis TaxID=6347 RepID=A0A8J1T7I7_OWEFU|nr:unnamed protein product [Owenia fusiformis]